MRNIRAADGEIFGTTILYAVIIALLAAMTSALVGVEVPTVPRLVQTAQNAAPLIFPAARPSGLG
jgi:predicted membrane-bound spermidine synthase